MVVKRSFSEKIFDVVNVILLLLLVVITIYPLLYVVFASFSNSDLLLAHRGLLLAPLGINLDAYSAVFKNPNILSGYKVTIFVVVVATTFNIIITSIGAYVLSRPEFKIRRVMMLLIVFTMYFSGGLIPKYLLINNYLHLGNNLLALILPNAIATWNLIIMRTNFEQVPSSLVEAAQIDGANHFTILFKVIMPLSKSVIAVMVLFYGVQHWNAWFDAMVYLRDRSLYPLQLILREILIINSMDSMTGGVDMGDVHAIGESIKHATIIVATIPILLVYPFVQKYFVSGMMIGAVKG